MDGKAVLRYVEAAVVVRITYDPHFAGFEASWPVRRPTDLLRVHSPSRTWRRYRPRIQGRR